MGDQISRPMQIVLLVTVLFGLVWFVALRPKAGATSDSSSTTSVPAAVATNGIVSAPDKARAAVAQSDATEAKVGAAADAAGSPSTSTTSSSTAASAPAAPRSATPAGTTAQSADAASRRAAKAPKVVAHNRLDAKAARALASHKVLVMLFYNPRASDDRAVRALFAKVSTRRGRVVKIAAPLRRLSSFKSVTARVQVTESPTVVIFDRKGEPRTLQGFVEPTVLSSRIADALASVPVADVAPQPR
jgi:predicted lipid-binding transport protein (Tim44 family)